MSTFVTDILLFIHVKKYVLNYLILCSLLCNFTFFFTNSAYVGMIVFVFHFSYISYTLVVDLAVVAVWTVQRFFLLSERTPLERCCVYNMWPFVSSRGLSPGIREPKFQRAKVCLNCTEPSVARSSCWLLPVDRAVLVGYTLQGLDGGPREVNCKQYGRRAGSLWLK